MTKPQSSNDDGAFMINEAISTPRNSGLSRYDNSRVWPPACPKALHDLIQMLHSPGNLVSCILKFSSSSSVG